MNERRKKITTYIKHNIYNNNNDKNGGNGGQTQCEYLMADSDQNSSNASQK